MIKFGIIRRLILSGENEKTYLVGFVKKTRTIIKLECRSDIMLLENLTKRNDEGEIIVNAYDLYEYLEVKSYFRDWIKRQLKRYNFEEGTDYTKITTVEEQQGTKNKIEVTTNNYYLSLNCAKELAMVERSAKGKEIRNYFIKLEELYHEQIENNIKVGSMLLTHKDKLNYTKEVFYPILERLGVIMSKKKVAHQRIIKSLFGKYENINQLQSITKEDIQRYEELAKELKSHSDYFVDDNQITVWDLINEK